MCLMEVSSNLSVCLSHAYVEKGVWTASKQKGGLEDVSRPAWIWTPEFYCSNERGRKKRKMHFLDYLKSSKINSIGFRTRGHFQKSRNHRNEELRGLP